MEAIQSLNDPSEDEEEFVFLDLESVSSLVNLPVGTSYTLSGLDTLNPVLVVGNTLKLIGEYQETMGTCLVFSEKVREPIGYPETGPSERNLFKETYILADKAKDVQPIASLQKVLKFRLATEIDAEKGSRMANARF